MNITRPYESVVIFNWSKYEWNIRAAQDHDTIPNRVVEGTEAISPLDVMQSGDNLKRIEVVNMFSYICFVPDVRRSYHFLK